LKNLQWLQQLLLEDPSPVPFLSKISSCNIYIWIAATDRFYTSLLRLWIAFTLVVKVPDFSSTNLQSLPLDQLELGLRRCPVTDKEPNLLGKQRRNANAEPRRERE
jgi:hypothetical protein